MAINEGEREGEGERENFTHTREPKKLFVRGKSTVLAKRKTFNEKTAEMRMKMEKICISMLASLSLLFGLRANCVCA